MNSTLFAQFFLPFIIRFFFFFGLIGLAVGIGMMLKPGMMQQLFAIANRWISTQRSLQWLDTAHDVEKPSHRLMQWMALLLLPVLTYATYLLITQGDTGSLVKALNIKKDADAFLVLIVTESVRWFLVVCGIVVTLACVMLVFFQKTLQAIEASANRWISTNNSTRWLDHSHMGFDAWVRSHPKAMGSLITLSGLVVCVNFGNMLFA